MENLFKKYVKEICVNCTNQDCENGKGIHVFSINGSKSARCTDYVSNCKIKKCGYVLENLKFKIGRNKA